MGLIDIVAGRIFKGYFSKVEEILRKSIGTEVYAEILRVAQNRPVYPIDNVESYINNGYLFNPLVYSIVSFLAQKAGAIPWGVYEVKNDKALQLYKSSTRPDFNTKVMKTKALVQLPNHELNQVFITPNILQGWAEFFEQVVGFKLVTGNSYIHMIGPTAGNNAGSIKELWHIPTQIIKPIAGNAIQPVKGYKYLNSNSILPPEQILHLKYWTPEYYNGTFLIGLSPIRAAHRLVTKSNSSFDSSVSSFQNMGAMGILSPEKEVEEFTEEQQDQLEERYRRKTGAKNAGKPLITSVPIKWQQIGMSPVDLNIIESDKMDLRSLCNIFHVPSELFNDASNKTYSNTKEAGSAVYTNAIIPALNQFRDTFNMVIKGRYGNVYVDYDVSMISELQDDLQMMTTALQNAHWISYNERRDIMNFPAIENNPLCDEVFFPMGLTPLSMMNEEPVSDEALNEAEKRLNLTDYGVQ